MSFYSKARGMVAAVAKAFKRPKVTVFKGLPDPVLSPPKYPRRPRPRRIAANGARLTVRYPANGHRP